VTPTPALPALAPCYADAPEALVVSGAAFYSDSIVRSRIVTSIARSSASTSSL
jgi:hypothetical protein